MMGWVASILLIVSMWLIGDKNSAGLIFGILGNCLWCYIGLKRNKQYDLAFIALVMAALNLVGLIKWLN